MFYGGVCLRHLSALKRRLSGLERCLSLRCVCLRMTSVLLRKVYVLDRCLPSVPVRKTSAWLIEVSVLKKTHRRSGLRGFLC